jgi:hypothetical protein
MKYFFLRTDSSYIKAAINQAEQCASFSLAAFVLRRRPALLALSAGLSLFHPLLAYFEPLHLQLPPLPA